MWGDDRTALQKQAEMIAESNAENLALKKWIKAIEDLQKRTDRISALIAQYEME